jgi:hypothetical protein
VGLDQPSALEIPLRDDDVDVCIGGCCELRERRLVSNQKSGSADYEPVEFRLLVCHGANASWPDDWLPGCGSGRLHHLAGSLSPDMILHDQKERV